MSDIGVGIIGCGNISAAYLRLSKMFKNLEIRAVADLNFDAAKARAEEFGVDARTVDELLASDDIQMIVNLTIPDAHYPVTKRILEAGKHAFSEKPLVLTLEQGEDLRAISEAKNLRVGCAPDTILGGSHQLARKKIDEGLVGKIIAGSAHVMSQGMESWHPNPDFFFLPGAGPMLDVGPYYVANLINLIGAVKRVAALTTSPTETRTIGSGDRAGETVPVKTPTNIHALLEFENGATITLSTSWDIKSHRHANMELYGTEGTIYVPDPNFFGGQVEYAMADGEIKPVEAWDHPLGVPNQENNQGEMMANYRTAGLADMASAIVEGREHRCSLERALHAVDVMTSILKSGETGQFVDIKTTCTQPAPLGIEEAQALLK
ncbi:MAG: Gfo/Idh/MocA family oxidoreductase [Rhizobiales bacterium]|nr:Gfo/Idh/MocA family oxidoreductase [Hyphomicrobiales bacterium]NRB14470.1 Gfo/Idh/MocA family oxidoreductase [Hyphomicrobiales bacterium]